MKVSLFEQVPYRYMPEGFENHHNSVVTPPYRFVEPRRMQELFWSVNGKNGESIIGEGSRSFETAVASRAAAMYGYRGHGWYICPKGSASNCTLSG